MSLLNKSAVRDYILEQTQKKRPGCDCTQVAGGVYERLENQLKTFIDRAVHSHPTVGHTFKEIL